MARRLLLLHLHLSLLHLLQHLLWSLHASLVCIGLLFGWHHRLIRILVGIIFLSCFCASLASGWVSSSGGTIFACVIPGLDWSGAGVASGARFCHENNARQLCLIRSRSQQHIVKARSIKQIRNHFPRRAWA